MCILWCNGFPEICACLEGGKLEGDSGSKLEVDFDSKLDGDSGSKLEGENMKSFLVCPLDVTCGG